MFGISSSVPAIDIKDKVVVGDELRMLVVTRVISRGIAEHSSTSSDLAGYLVVVNISNDATLISKTKIYGPLFTCDIPRSSICLDANALYGVNDSDARNATPVCVFDVDGTLLKFSSDSAGKAVKREMFEADAKHFSWVLQGIINHADVSPVLGGDRVISSSGRFMLTSLADRPPVLIDRYRGESIRDDWLTDRFANAVSIAKMTRCNLFLTDDLNTFVVDPWEHGRFELNGRDYKGSEVGLAFSRPSVGPIVFPKLRNPRTHEIESARGIISIKNEAFVYYIDEAAVHLSRLDSKKTFDLTTPTDSGVSEFDFSKCRYDPVSGRVAIFFSNRDQHDIPVGELAPEKDTIVSWNLEKSNKSVVNITVRDLFEMKSGKYSAKNIITSK